MRRHTLLAVAFLIALPARADLLLLNDGTRMEGDIKKAADGWFVTDRLGKITHVPADSVKSSQLTGRGETKDAAAEKLGGLTLLVNCIGKNREQKLAEVTEETFDDIYGTNLKSAK